MRCWRRVAAPLTRVKGKNTTDRFQEIIAEDQPYTFLYVPEDLIIISSRFRGIEPAPIGLDYNFIKWYVPQGEQKFVDDQMITYEH